MSLFFRKSTDFDSEMDQKTNRKYTKNTKSKKLPNKNKKPDVEQIFSKENPERAESPKQEDANNQAGFISSEEEEQIPCGQKSPPQKNNEEKQVSDSDRWNADEETENDVIQDEDNEEEEVESFLYIKGTSNDITALSPLRVMGTIFEILHRNPNVVKVNRSLRVTCNNKSEENRIREITHLMGHPVEITDPFSRTNQAKLSNRGIIFGVDDDITNDEITMAVGTRAERVIKKRGGSKITTAQVILHFEGPMPEYVKLGWKRHRVSVYIPDPTRCYKCQRYGHIVANCKAKKDKCPICAGDHIYQNCLIKDKHGKESKATCPNCKGDHPASYQGCPAYKQAKIVRKIQTNEGLTYAEALKRHRIENDNKQNNDNNKMQQQSQIPTNDVRGNTQTSSAQTRDHDQIQKPVYKHAETQTENIVPSSVSSMVTTQTQAVTLTEKHHAPSSESSLNNNDIEQIENPLHSLICKFVRDIGHLLQQRDSTKYDLTEKLYEMIGHFAEETSRRRNTRGEQNQ